jgi:hypothetical protein
MKIFARHALIERTDEPSGEELLLEGSWREDERRSGRWSLDETMDTRFASIDRRAMELAHRAGQACAASPPAVTFPYINALALRYYLVKLLRVVTFFRHIRPLRRNERVALHLAVGDEHYAELCEQIAAASGAQLVLHWRNEPHQSRSSSTPPAAWPGLLTGPRMASTHCVAELVRVLAVSRSGDQTSHEVCYGPVNNPGWRHWAARARRWRPTNSHRHNGDRPQVVLCGNPRILNPVCAELVARGARVSWLHERFAVRCWWRWRNAGVEQLICDANGRLPPSFSDVAASGDLVIDGVDLARPVDRWLNERAVDLGRYQALLVERVESHFRNIRPTALVVDEDATPLKRIAVALARRFEARSTVIQHGAPCGPFGFAPLAADEIAVWGNASRRQLEAWGLPADKIRVAGWPKLTREFLKLAPAARPRVARARRFLLLTTMPPQDDRPDNLEFHLTSDNYAAMLDMVCQVLCQLKSATLTVKLHPRDARRMRSWSGRSAAGKERQGDKETRRQGEEEISLSPRPLLSLSSAHTWANYHLRVVQSQDLESLIADSDCVLSCASTAGIEAALAGAPVIQLLPAGSGNVLPADEWGFIGSARTAEELGPLIEQALARGWHKDLQTLNHVLASHGREAAAQIVNGVIDTANRRWGKGWAATKPGVQ